MPFSFLPTSLYSMVAGSIRSFFTAKFDLGRFSMIPAFFMDCTLLAGHGFLAEGIAVISLFVATELAFLLQLGCVTIGNAC